MNQSLRPQPLISEVLPGAFMLGLLLLDFFTSHPGEFSNLLTSKETSATSALIVGTGAFLLLSWIVGTFFDSCRNLLENGLDKCRWLGRLDWKFFFKGEREKGSQLEDHYFAYYILNFNYVIAAGWFFVVKLCLWLSLSYSILIPALVIIVAVIFGCDAFWLRKEIRDLFDNDIPSHHGAYTRLKASKIDSVSKERGVGVFAIREIPKGTSVFAGDLGDMVERNQNMLAGLDPALRCLYEDFCVFKDGKMLCPRTFNSLTIGWHLNHSQNPNVQCDADYNFVAIRDIKKDEELTADYSKYSDPAPGRRSFTELCQE